MNKGKAKLYIADLLLLFLFVAVDQFTKYLAVLKLKGQPDVPIIDNVLTLQYLENYGAAFGLLQNQKTFFVISASLFLCLILFVIIKMPNSPKYHHSHLLLVAVAAGAAGNLLDRVRLGYVVDFVYIELINFPIFNVADMYVTFSAALIAVQILFVFEDEDLAFLFSKKQS